MAPLQAFDVVDSGGDSTLSEEPFPRIALQSGSYDGNEIVVGSSEQIIELKVGSRIREGHKR